MDTPGDPASDLQRLLVQSAPHALQHHRKALAAVGRLRRLLDHQVVALLAALGASREERAWSLARRWLRAPLAALDGLYAHLWLSSSRKQQALVPWSPWLAEAPEVAAAWMWVAGASALLDPRWGADGAGWLAWSAALGAQEGVASCWLGLVRAWGGLSVAQAQEIAGAAGLRAVVGLLEVADVPSSGWLPPQRRDGGFVPIVRCGPREGPQVVALLAASGWQAIAVEQGPGVESRLHVALELALGRPPCAIAWEVDPLLGVPPSLVAAVECDVPPVELASELATWLLSYHPDRLLDEHGTPTTFLRDALREDGRRAASLDEDGRRAASLDEDGRRAPEAFPSPAASLQLALEHL